MIADSIRGAMHTPFDSADLTLPLAMAEASPAAVLVLDANGTAVLMNSRMRDLFELPDHYKTMQDIAVIRRHVDEMIVEPVDFSESIDAVLEAPDLSMVETVTLRDGRYLEVSCSPLRLADRTAGRIWFAREITDVMRDAEAKSFDAAVMEDTAAEMVNLAEEYYHLKAESDAACERLERQQKLLEKLANTDSLTGIANRRAFMEAAEQAITESRETGRPLSVAVIDYDLFKDVNDRYGHNAGDRVLRETVEVMRQCLPEAAMLARLGGEEFALLCPGCDGDRSQAVCENLRHAVATRVVQLKSVPLQISVSVGVATLQDNDTDIESLLRRADKALYVAKDDGRNCVRRALHPSNYRQDAAFSAR